MISGICSGRVILEEAGRGKGMKLTSFGTT